MLQVAGSHISNDIWFRIAQILTGFEGTELDVDIQHYAAAKTLDSLKVTHAHDPLVKLAAYVLGEYGDTIVEKEEDAIKQYKALIKHYDNSNSDTKCMILSTLVKITSRSNNIKEKVIEFMKSNIKRWELDLQQRAVEYLALLQSNQFDEKKGTILERIPGFPEAFLYNNVILRSLHQLQLKKEEEKNVKIDAKDTPIDKSSTLTEDGLKSNVIYLKNEKDFAKRVCINAEKVLTSLVPVSNSGYFKKLMMLNEKEGLLFENTDIVIATKANFNSFMCRCLIKLNAKRREMKSIEPELIVPGGYVMECSKVKYDTANNTASFMVQTMICTPTPSVPSLRVLYNLTTHSAKTEEFALPILIANFIKPQETTFDIAHNLWNKLSNCSGALDAILPNPSPLNLTHIQVLTKIAQLLHEVLGFYVIPPKDQTNFTSLYAIGNLLLKHPNQASFPTSEINTLPPTSIQIITQTAFYPDIAKEEFRFSIRSENTIVSGSILSAFKLFINKS